VSTSEGLPDAEEALNFILAELRARGPATHGQHGYDLTVMDMAVRWRRAKEPGLRGNLVDSERTYAVSVPFYDAAWELARRGVLRPSVRTSFMQWSGFNAAGGGYTLTAIGQSWLERLGAAPLQLLDPWGPFERT
jgi:hypothetical protein